MKTMSVMKKTMSVMKKAMSAMKRAMKAKKVMKTMKKRVMKVSVIAKNKCAKASVFRGKKEKTTSGLTKAALTKNKRGKVVSKKAAAHGRKQFAKNLSGWNKAVMAARKELGIKGFAPVGRLNVF